MEGAANYVQKIYEIVNDPATDDVIYWNPTGESFIITDIHSLTVNILRQHFKLTKFQSFRRQLHAYGFQRTRNAFWEFENANFKRGHPELLANIQRR